MSAQDENTYSFYVVLQVYGWPDAAAQVGTALALAATGCNEEYTGGDQVGAWALRKGDLRTFNQRYVPPFTDEVTANTGWTVSDGGADWSYFPSAWANPPADLGGGGLPKLQKLSPAALLLPGVQKTVRAWSKGLGTAGASNLPSAEWKTFASFPGTWSRGRYSSLQQQAARLRGLTR